MKTILFLALSLLTIQTSELPTYGSISGIKDAKKVYVTSENEDSRKRVIKALGKDKTLEVVNSPDEAQFFIEYSELSREAVSTDRHINDRQQRNQMRVYTFSPVKQKTIIWSDTVSRDTEHFMGMKMYDGGRGEGELTGRFLKALKKAREGKP
jgi:hypothetical protein